MSQAALSESALSLDTVTENFNHWRKTRLKIGKTPTELMEQAFSLVGRYPITKIASSLGLCCSSFKKKCIGRGLIANPTKPTFVTVRQTSKPIDTAPENDIYIELLRTDGAKMHVSFSQAGTAAQLMTQFLKA